MSLAVLAVGRLKASAERDLVARYRSRAEPLARTLGFGVLDLIELAEGRGRREAERRGEEAKALLAAVAGRSTIVFDERGDPRTSAELAQCLAAWRDAGAAIGFVIGGPDGLDGAVRARADLVLSFGRMTIPHQIVRVLVVEQLYRAMTILSGHPYHRATGE